MTIGFIGCGNMGSALARAVSKRGAYSISLYDLAEEKARILSAEIGAEVTDMAGISSADAIFLGVKPYGIREVVGKLEELGCRAMLISMAAGVKLSSIEEVLSRSLPLIRIMPNTPVQYGEGVILYSLGGAACKKHEALLLDLLKEGGMLCQLPEELIDAGSAVSGSGPAFFYMFIDALARGGEAAGLDYSEALTLAAKTAVGAGITLLESGRSPEELRAAVCSPGGSTIEGVGALNDGGLDATVAEAVKRTFEKAKKLG